MTRSSRPMTSGTSPVPVSAAARRRALLLGRRRPFRHSGESRNPDRRSGRVADSDLDCGFRRSDGEIMRTSCTRTRRAMVRQCFGPPMHHGCGTGNRVRSGDDDARVALPCATSGRRSPAKTGEPSILRRPHPHARQVVTGQPDNSGRDEGGYYGKQGQIPPSFRRKPESRSAVAVSAGRPMDTGFRRSDERGRLPTESYSCSPVP